MQQPQNKGTRRRLATGIAMSSIMLASSLAMPSMAMAETSASLQAKLTAAKKKSEDLNEQAADAAEKLNDTNAQLDELAKQISEKEASIASKRGDLDDTLSTNYKKPADGVAQAVAGSTSLDDLVSSVTYALNVTNQSSKTIDGVVSEHQELQEKKAAQEQLKSEQQQASDDLQKKSDEAKQYVDSLDSQVKAKLAEEQEAARQASIQASQAAAQSVQQSVTASAGSSSSSSSASSSASVDGTHGRLTTAQRQQIIAYAQSKVGHGYVYGASGPNVFDCSGLVMAAYASAGISLSHSSSSQYYECSGHTSVSNLLPGDLVCYGGHVGIYMGNGMMIDAANPGKGVVYRAVYGSPRGAYY